MNSRIKKLNAVFISACLVVIVCSLGGIALRRNSTNNRLDINDGKMVLLENQIIEAQTRKVELEEETIAGFRKTLENLSEHLDQAKNAKRKKERTGDFMSLGSMAGSLLMLVSILLIRKQMKNVEQGAESDAVNRAP